MVGIRPRRRAPYRRVYIHTHTHHTPLRKGAALPLTPHTRKTVPPKSFKSPRNTVWDLKDLNDTKRNGVPHSPFIHHACGGRKFMGSAAELIRNTPHSPFVHHACGDRKGMGSATALIRYTPSSDSFKSPRRPCGWILKNLMALIYRTHHITPLSPRMW